MPSCCITDCKNRQYTSRKLKFYRIPSDYRPFQANRRRLWLRAIQQANGSAEPLKENARICGAHFISGEASMDHDSPDFVPSVFARTLPSTKKKRKWVYGSRKRRRRAAHTEEKTAPPTVESPVDLQSSALMEETQTASSPSEPKEGKALIKEVEAETKAVKEQRTFKVPTGIPKLDSMIPVVLLKSVFAPGKGYRCELCNQLFPIASQLVKHKQLHEEEEKEEEEKDEEVLCTICGKLFTSEAAFTEHQRVHESAFPCNMCDRSFTTNQHLKRHKLLHVRDGRKCKKCGVLFCQLHKHILFQPQPQPQTCEESSSESEEESSIAKPQHLGSSLMPENNQLVKPVPSQTAQSTISVTPSQETTAQTASCAPPNLNPLPETHEVENNQLVKPVPNQTADLHDDVQSTTTVTPLQETTAQIASCAPPNLKPLPETHEVENNQLVKLVLTQTADLCEDVKSTITVTPMQETTAQIASCAPPNLKPLPETHKVENNQLVKLVLTQTADLCEDVQSTITVTTLQETTAQHVQEPLFSCNKCDQSYTTSYGLTRHKLMHLQESKRCNTCGRLFCQCHTDILSQPQTQNCEESCSTSEQVPSITKPQHLGSSLLPVNNLLVNSETNQTADPHDPHDPHVDAQSTITVTPSQETTAQTASCAPPNLNPLPKTHEVEPPTSETEISSEIPVPDLIRSFTVPCPRRLPRPSPRIRLQHPNLPPSLKLFSPEYLTSTFIEVTRNYDYILSKSRGVKMEEDVVQEENYVVKEEPCELPLSPPKELKIVNVRHVKKESVERVKKEKIAYDLEFVL